VHIPFTALKREELGGDSVAKLCTSVSMQFLLFGCKGVSMKFLSMKFLYGEGTHAPHSNECTTSERVWGAQTILDEMFTLTKRDRGSRGRNDENELTVLLIIAASITRGMMCGRVERIERIGRRLSQMAIGFAFLFANKCIGN
jgi:hypothetical protein